MFGRIVGKAIPFASRVIGRAVPAGLRIGSAVQRYSSNPAFSQIAKRIGVSDTTIRKIKNTVGDVNSALGGLGELYKSAT